MEKTKSVKELVDEGTKETLKLPDINKNLEIADLIKKDRKHAKEVAEAMQKIFRGQRTKK
jgi:hypothetical protein